MLLHVRIESSTSPAYGKCWMSLTDGSWPYLKKIKIMKMGKGEVTTKIMRTIMKMMRVMMMVMIVMMRK